MDTRKNTAVTVISVILAVVVLLAVTLLLRGITRSVARETDSTWNSYDIPDEFQSIQVTAPAGEIYVYSSYDDVCTVYSSGSRNSAVDIRVEDGVLLVHQEDRSGWLRQLFAGAQESSVSLALPVDLPVDLSVEAASGYVSISDALTFRTVDVSITSGDVWMADIAADRIAAETTSGNIMLDDLAAGALDLSTASGDVSLYSITADRIVAETASGNIQLDEINAGAFDLSTASGDISAWLYGPMDFDLSTVSGSIGAPASDPSGTPFRASTVSGDIWIDWY